MSIKCHLSYTGAQFRPALWQLNFFVGVFFISSYTLAYLSNCISQYHAIPYHAYIMNSVPFNQSNIQLNIGQTLSCIQFLHVDELMCL